MSHDRDAMGEQPIFTCHAHVFHIDPKTKRTWITASTKAVAVSFFYDSSRNLYRIISVEGSKAVINSTITPNMSFTQTSQKFGQWSDVRANTVYGLGFSSEAELTKFVEKFQEVKEATKNSTQKNTTNGSSAATPVTSANTSPVTGRTGLQQQQQTQQQQQAQQQQQQAQQQQQQAQQQQQQQQHHQQQQQHQQQQNDERNNIDQMSVATANIQLSNKATPDSPMHTKITTNASNIEMLKQASSSLNNSSTESGPHSEQQLKYENERLKLALAQSCANAKKWEIELTTLKSNNNRLTSALQESTANVDEWKRQLHTYKEENLRLKREMDAMKPSTGGAGGNTAAEFNEELRIENIKLRSRIITLEKELQEQNLKASKSNAKDKSNEQYFKRLGDINDKFSKTLVDMCNVQQEMEKIIQDHKST